MGGNVELLHWKERYHKDLRFATVDDLATQARHGIYPRQNQRSHRIHESFAATMPASSAKIETQSQRSRRSRRRDGSERGHTSAGMERPELPALTMEPHGSHRSSRRSHRSHGESRRRAVSRIPLFGSTYQSDFAPPPGDRLDIERDRYGMPRDFMVNYREACHVSVGKASLFVKTTQEAAESLKKFDMNYCSGEYKF